MSDTFPPSPIPPWHRPVVSPVTQTLLDGGVISLNVNTTYLNQTTPKNPEDLAEAYECSLADGNYPQQRKTIQIWPAAVSTTAVWRVTGNFVDAVALRFDKLGQACDLIWAGDAEGGSWSVLGGNATKEDQ